MAALWIFLSYCGVWQADPGGPAVVVAIVDDGVDDTRGRLREHLAINDGEIPANGFDDDHDGLIDDVSGFDFLDRKPSARPANVAEGMSHGTLMATLALRASCPDERAGQSGCAGRAVQILPLRVANQSGVDPAAAAEAIRYAARRRQRVVVNLSMGTIHRHLPEQVVAAIAPERNVLFVVAAGNQGHDIAQLPASLCQIDVPNLICVAALDDDGNLATFPKASNYGSLAAVAALGVDAERRRADGTAHRETGTSLAAATVSGIAAAVWAAAPSLTSAELASALCSGAQRRANLRQAVRCGVADLAGSLQSAARASHGPR